MFATLNNPAAAYSQAGVEAKSTTASPHELVLMLYDGALASIASASHHMRSGNVAEKGDAVSKAIEIIENGLKACLDYRGGGDLADRLGALYEYMGNRLLHANLRNDNAALGEVSGLLRELRGAWQEISSDSAVVSPTKAAA
jgi:flagellar protein FliS